MRTHRRGSTRSAVTTHRRATGCGPADTTFAPPPSNGRTRVQPVEHPVASRSGRGSRNPDEVGHGEGAVRGGGGQMLGFVLRALRYARRSPIVVVVGDQREKVAEYLQRVAPGARIAGQERGAGTGDAARQALPAGGPRRCRDCLGPLRPVSAGIGPCCIRCIVRPVVATGDRLVPAVIGGVPMANSTGRLRVRATAAGAAVVLGGIFGQVARCRTRERRPPRCGSGCEGQAGACDHWPTEPSGIPGHRHLRQGQGHVGRSQAEQVLAATASRQRDIAPARPRWSLCRPDRDPARGQGVRPRSAQRCPARPDQDP